MTLPINSPLFGPGEIRNPNLSHLRLAEFNNLGKPRLFVFPDGTFSLSGTYGSCAYGGTVDTIDDVAAEIKRLVNEVKV